MEWKCRPLERVRPSSRNTPTHPLSFSLIFLAPHSHTRKYTHPAKMTLSAHPNTLCYTLALLRLLGIISKTENRRSWVWLFLWASVSFCVVNTITGCHRLTHTHTEICHKSNLVMISQGWTHKYSWKQTSFYWILLLEALLRVEVSWGGVTVEHEPCYSGLHSAEVKRTDVCTVACACWLLTFANALVTLGLLCSTIKLWWISPNLLWMLSKI